MEGKSVLQVAMRNLQSPYVCGICKKGFHIPRFLIKHVEFRHPTKSRKFSTNTNLFNNSKKISAPSKNNEAFDNDFEFVSINVVETEKIRDEVDIQKKSIVEKSKNLDNQICDETVSQQTEFEKLPKRIRENMNSMLSDISNETDSSIISGKPAFNSIIPEKKSAVRHHVAPVFHFCGKKIEFLWPKQK